MMTPRKLKPGPKTDAAERHRKAALYFCAIAIDEGWTPERTSELCLKLYGVKITPLTIRDWSELNKKFAEFRTKDGPMLQST
jgi:hypothetical protein